MSDGTKKNDKKTEEDKSNSTYPGIGLVIGTALGAAIGSALDQISIGIAIGLALGLIYDGYSNKKTEK